MIRNFSALYFILADMPREYDDFHYALTRLGIPTMCYFDGYRVGGDYYDSLWLVYRMKGPQMPEGFLRWSVYGHFEGLWLTHSMAGVDSKYERISVPKAVDMLRQHVNLAYKEWPEVHGWERFIKAYQAIMGKRVPPDLLAAIRPSLRGEHGVDSLFSEV